MTDVQTNIMQEAGPIQPGGRRDPLASLLLPPGAGVALLILSACMASTPEARRQTYLDCARAQGVTVRDGTIVTRSSGDLARLDTCKAVPR